MSTYCIHTVTNIHCCCRLSIGFSSSFTPENAMVQSDAVIGLPQSSNQAFNYVIDSKSPQRILQNRVGASIGEVSQSSGKTTLYFRRNLQGTSLHSLTPGHDVHMIWAYGTSNKFGNHGRSRGSTLFLLGGMCQTDEDCPTVSRCSNGVCTTGKSRRKKTSSWLSIETGAVNMAIRYMIRDKSIHFEAKCGGSVW